MARPASSWEQAARLFLAGDRESACPLGADPKGGAHASSFAVYHAERRAVRVVGVRSNPRPGETPLAARPGAALSRRTRDGELRQTRRGGGGNEEPPEGHQALGRGL